MAKKTANLEIKILGDASSATRAFGEAEGKAGGLMSKLGVVAGVAGAAVAGFAAIGKASFDAASAVQQSTGAIDSVFGDWAVDIEQSAQAADKALGLSVSGYENLASVIGAQLAGAGMAHGEMVDKTQDLITKGADLAATFGGTTTEAVEALSSALKGEMDPLERYGVSLKQSDISAQLAAKGQDKLTGTALKTATAQAALDLITKQTASSQGAFAKESDTAAGKQERLAAMFENLKAKLGEGLLPIFVKAADFVMTKVVPALADLTKKGGPLSTMFATVGKFIQDKVVPAVKDLFTWASAHLIPIFKDVGKFITGTVVPAFKKLWEFVSTYLIPYFKKVMGPAIDGVRDAFRKIAEKIEDNKGKFDKLYKALEPVFKFMRDKVAPFLGGALKTAFEVAGDAIGVVVDTVGWLVEKLAWIIDHGASAAKWVGGLFDTANPAALAPAPAPMGLFAATPEMRGASMFSAGGGSIGPGATAGGLPTGDTYVFNVSGLIGDKDELAATIVKLLNGRNTRIGARPAVVLA